jgi:dTDP-4-amino-4,6-dideoxygalactose transaminase
MRVPFLDLHGLHQPILSEILSSFEQVIEKNDYILGSEVTKFEKKFAQLHDSKYCVGVSNGTSALIMALRYFQITKDDEVIVPANSFIATSEAVTHAGGTIRFADINSQNYLLDPYTLENFISPKTKGIIAVHLYGQMCDMEKIHAIAKKHGLFIIEDCAQAHLATRDNKYPGTFGDVACFSFYPGKNLGAFGDAGAIITNNILIAQKIRAMRNHGRLEGQKYEHEFEGYNERIDSLQCAVLNVKLKYLQEWTTKRQNCAAYYNKLLSSVPKITTPIIEKRSSHVFHLYVLKLDPTLNREKFIEYLNSRGIGTGVHYPIPLPLLKAYKYLNVDSISYKNASELSSSIVSLPMYPNLTTEQINFVASAIIEFIENEKD